MNDSLRTFIFGMIIGGGAMFFLLNKSSPISAEMKITSSDPKAVISNEQLDVNTKYNIVQATASFQTDRAGIYTNTITINRRDLQFRHTVSIESGYFLKSQLPFLSLSYSYHWFLISTKVGYLFRLNTIDYGIGIGVKFSF
ncbi:MAG: hypothetical protein ACRC0X_06040 [Brevinema sp.]